MPCKRVFSLGKETKTPWQNKIHHSLIEALQGIKSGIIGGYVLSFTAGTSKEEEITHLEADTSDPAPPNMSDFIQYINTVISTNEGGEEDNDSMYKDN